MSAFLEKITVALKLGGTNGLILLSVLVGLSTGLGAIGFGLLINHSNEFFFGLTDQTLMRMAAFLNLKLSFGLPLIPMLGGLLVGPIVFYFAREAKGHGVPEVMNAVARLGGVIRPRVAAAKAIASAICLGSGGSAGREGPIVQIGSAIGSTFGQIFGMSGDRIKLLVACGAAAGISSVFNAPIAGVIFSLEVILGDFAIHTFAPVLISSVVASVVTRTVLGDHPAFQVPAYTLASAWEIPLYMLLGAILGVVAVLFTRTLDLFEDLFDKLALKPHFKPAIGGLLLGTLAIFFPQVLADGYETISLTLHSQMAMLLLVALIFMKILATSLTLGSGNSGGIFAPSLFMGAMTGGAFGHLVNLFWPNQTASPGAYALVGMAGLVAGTTHAPLTALLIIFEMTNDYRIILPLMVTVAIASVIARFLFKPSIYTVKLLKRGIDIRSGKDIGVLRATKVNEVMDTRFETIRSDLSLKQIFHRVADSTESYFVVVDRGDEFKGMVTLQDLRSLITQQHAAELILAADIAKPAPIVIHPEDSLEEALNQLDLRGLKLLPVVAPLEPNRVVGVVRRESLVDFYNRRLLDVVRA